MRPPRELLALLAQGDREALGLLYELFKNKVYNTALSYLHDSSDAEEVTQDVFIEVYRSAAKFEARSEVSTWIYRITVNRSLDKLRQRERTRRGGFFKRMLRLDSEEVNTQATEFNHPGVALEQREDSQLLFSALDTLPDQQKTAFILKHLEGLSQKEGAEIMNITEKAFESLLQRAKTNLRKKLSE